jgi:hypothetical protein
MYVKIALGAFAKAAFPVLSHLVIFREALLKNCNLSQIAPFSC